MFKQNDSSLEDNVFKILSNTILDEKSETEIQLLFYPATVESTSPAPAKETLQASELATTSESPSATAKATAPAIAPAPAALRTSAPAAMPTPAPTPAQPKSVSSNSTRATRISSESFTTLAKRIKQSTEVNTREKKLSCDMKAINTLIADGKINDC